MFPEEGIMLTILKLRGNKNETNNQKSKQDSMMTLKNLKANQNGMRRLQEDTPGEMS